MAFLIIYLYSLKAKHAKIEQNFIHFKINLYDIFSKMSFIYSLIANDRKIILADNTEYNGNFSQIVRLLLDKIEKEGKVTMDYDK